jgi:hypothetical protein
VSSHDRLKLRHRLVKINGARKRGFLIGLKHRRRWGKNVSRGDRLRLRHRLVKINGARKRMFLIGLEHGRVIRRHCIEKSVGRGHLKE